MARAGSTHVTSRSSMPVGSGWCGQVLVAATLMIHTGVTAHDGPDAA